jgi:pentatricopeptide repeat protein
MEHYATGANMAKAVELLGHMLEAKMKPSVNTFRILITACQRAGQPELAFEVLSAMKTRGLMPKEVSAAAGHRPAWRGPAPRAPLLQARALEASCSCWPPRPLPGR